MILFGVKLFCIEFSFAFSQNIAHAYYCMNYPLLPVCFQFLSQVVHININHVGANVKVGLRVFRGAGAPKDYYSKTGPDGIAVIKGVPSNPMIQRMLEEEETQG